MTTDQMSEMIVDVEGEGVDMLRAALRADDATDKGRYAELSSEAFKRADDLGELLLANMFSGVQVSDDDIVAAQPSWWVEGEVV